jgi:hypothetical protein
MKIQKNRGRNEEYNDNTTDRRWKNISVKKGRDKSTKKWQRRGRKEEIVIPIQIQRVKQVTTKKSARRSGKN